MNSKPRGQMQVIYIYNNNNNSIQFFIIYIIIQLFIIIIIIITQSLADSGHGVLYLCHTGKLIEWWIGKDKDENGLSCMFFREILCDEKNWSYGMLQLVVRIVTIALQRLNTSSCKQFWTWMWKFKCAEAVKYSTSHSLSVSVNRASVLGRNVGFVISLVPASWETTQRWVLRWVTGTRQGDINFKWKAS
jgi:hypothetical protein